jgi:hypothetical protein
VTVSQRDAAADQLAECTEGLLKFLRVSLAAGPMSCNPRTETWHLQRLKTALAAYRAASAHVCGSPTAECDVNCMTPDSSAAKTSAEDECPAHMSGCHVRDGSGVCPNCKRPV